MTSCRYHCRACESHFTSLLAFDSHRAKGKCTKPKKLVKTKGGCKIGDPSNPLQSIDVYELPRTEEYRQKMKCKKSTLKK